MTKPQQIQSNKQQLIEDVVRAWKDMQATQPLVHYITNTVAANYAANVLLACGASPALIDNPYEAQSFMSIAGSLNINLGTPTEQQVKAMHIAAKTAHDLNKPWVLDPVGYGAILGWRSQIIDELLEHKPSIIRGNGSEISTLAGQQSVSKGVDSTLSSAEVYKQAQVLLQHCECIAISGESDFILSKALNCVIQVNGGSYLQPKITATGCALGALIAAYAAVSNPTIATLAAHIHFAIAGKLAFAQAQSVGSFNVAFLDELYNLNADTILQHADIQVLAI
jgi:hydroxyethylthiazole kinase